MQPTGGHGLPCDSAVSDASVWGETCAVRWANLGYVGWVLRLRRGGHRLCAAPGAGRAPQPLQLGQMGDLDVAQATAHEYQRPRVQRSRGEARTLFPAARRRRLDVAVAVLDCARAHRTHRTTQHERLSSLHKRPQTVERARSRVGRTGGLGRRRGGPAVRLLLRLLRRLRQLQWRERRSSAGRPAHSQPAWVVKSIKPKARGS